MCQPIQWSSHEAKRITRSVFGDELIAFGDAFDIALLMKTDIVNMMIKSIRLNRYSDSLCLFEILTKETIPIGKHLMIDLFCIKNAYTSGEIDVNFFIRSEYNLADSLTKKTKSSALLDTL